MCVQMNKQISASYAKYSYELCPRQQKPNKQFWPTNGKDNAYQLSIQILKDLFCYGKKVYRMFVLVFIETKKQAKKHINDKQNRESMGLMAIKSTCWASQTTEQL